MHLRDARNLIADFCSNAARHGLCPRRTLFQEPGTCCPLYLLRLQKAQKDAASIRARANRQEETSGVFSRYLSF